MRTAATAELYVNASIAECEDILATWSSTGGISLAGDLAGETPWSRSLPARRHRGTWRRGRRTGAVTIDLVPADATRTLLVLTLSPAGRFTARPSMDHAGAVARAIRTAVERGAPAWSPAAPMVATPPRPVAHAVGYSRA